MLPNCLWVRHQHHHPQDKGMVPSRDTTASLDPTKILERVPLPSAMAQGFTCCPFAPGLYPEFGSPFTCPFTLLLANIKGTALLPPVPLMWNNWSRHRRSRDCFFLCPCCSSPSESCQFTCAALVFAWALRITTNATWLE